MRRELLIGFPNDLARIDNLNLLPTSVVSAVNKPILANQAPVHGMFGDRFDLSNVLVATLIASVPYTHIHTRKKLETGDVD